MKKNSKTIDDGSNVNSRQLFPLDESSVWTGPSKKKLETVPSSLLTTSTNGMDSLRSICRASVVQRHSAGDPDSVERRPQPVVEEGEGTEVTPYVGVGTLGTAGSQTADITMSAIDADKIIGGRSTNVKRRAVEVEGSRRVREAKQPRYARIMFGYGEVGRTPAATYTEMALPIPNVPDYELANEVVSSTIQRRADLFKIVTHVKSRALRLVTSVHPNKPLVESLCAGFESGFWPYADTLSADSEEHKRTGRLSDDVLEFLRTQRDAEIEVERYSEAFPKLLPGMITQPIFAVPKKGTTKLRLINDHSAGNKSLNSLIPMEGGFMQLDTLQDLGTLIWNEMRRIGGKTPTWIFKSDASQAYRRLPVHPHWQV